MATDFEILHERSLQRINSLRGSIPGSTIFCVGTGPSITKTDLKLLEGLPVVLVNHAFLLLDKFTPSYRCQILTDDSRVRALRPKLIALGGDTFVAPYNLSFDPAPYDLPFLCLLPEGEMLHYKLIGFSADIATTVYIGFSVIFTAIQVAAHLGAHRIVLVGVDMDYHSGQQYFDPCITREDKGFRYETHARTMFECHRDALASRAVQLLDATVGGRIDVLPKVSLNELLVSKDPFRDDHCDEGY